MSFLRDFDPRDWDCESDELTCEELYLGQGDSALEVVILKSDSKPRQSLLTNTWKERRGRRVNPVFLVPLYDDKAAICGPTGGEDENSPPIRTDLEPDQVRRICSTALSKENRHSVHRFFSRVIDQIDDDLIGIRNRGLVSTHELKVGVPSYAEWQDGTENGNQVLGMSGRSLVENLGFNIERLTGQSGFLLKEGERDTAVAIFLDESESFDHPQERFSKQTPVSYALKKADDKRVQYVIGTSNKTIRLYSTDSDTGFGSRGRADTFVEADLDLIPSENAAYLWLMFSAEALSDEGTFSKILSNSKDFAAGLGERLRERIYDDVIPDLAKAIAEEKDLDDPTREELNRIYQMALTTLYRLLFIAYTEDEGFLPRHNPNYDARSLKQKAHELHRLIQEGQEFDPQSINHWNDFMRLVEEINTGNKEWSLPEYDGKLMSSDPEITGIGAELASIELSNQEFGPILTNLLIDETSEGYQGPVDFRNVGVREFGVIYEGLLESELSTADQDLGLNKDDRYVPVSSEEEVQVEKGEVYLHGRSGERKSTGTYYTKSIFVNHLLDYSLEPALDDHIDRLEGLEDRDAEQAFFDFRVADISMGSGHFLVGAVDRIEERLSNYLHERSLPEVEEELDRMLSAAEEAYEDTGEQIEIERSQLLRRQIARRCVYGVDLNPLATELSRLSIWIHTFVPGLPLTFLNHNLITGDSLSGIGSFDELADVFSISDDTLLGFAEEAGKKLDDIKDNVNQLGQLADLNAQEIKQARETQRVIEEQFRDVKVLFDIVAGSRVDADIDLDQIDLAEDIGSLQNTENYEKAKKSLENLNPVHFPFAFPEVFQGDNPGFDVIIGNPPWEEATLEEDEFWMRYEPGLQGMTQAKQERIKDEYREERPELVTKLEGELEEQENRRKVLLNGPYPGMGTGDPDFYKAFCWRFWNLLRDEGYCGVVLPRSVFVAAGSEDFRTTLLDDAITTDLTFLVNNGCWVFDTHPQYTIALLSFKQEAPDEEELLPLRGPFSSKKSYLNGKEKEPHKFRVSKSKNWTKTSSFPLLPSLPRSVEVFKKIFSDHPPLDKNDDLDEWRARPTTDFHATNDKTLKDGTRLMHFTDDPPDDFWPIWKGETFDHWSIETGEIYAWADPEKGKERLQQKRQWSFKMSRTFSEFSKNYILNHETLPCLSARVAFRDISRATDRRTVRPALVPPKVFLTNKAPYFLWPRGDEKDEAYLLGVLSSIPLDWYARRFIETSVNYHILKKFPIPRPDRNSPLWQRIVEISGRLASVDDRFNEWAEKVGVNYGSLEDDRKKSMIYELDAVVSHLYGLSEEDVRLIFQTFHEGWDYQQRLENVLNHYHEWEERNA